MKKKRRRVPGPRRPCLKNLEKQFDLEIKLVINLDAISDQGDGSSGRVVTYGSIGKLLLTAFVHGKQTHAGYPQDGVNAAYVAAELLTEFELSPLLSERTGEELAAPPTALHSKDSKTGYNVTTPQQAWVYWNTMQHQRTAGEVFDIAMDHARRAVDRAKARTQSRHRFDQLCGTQGQACLQSAEARYVTEFSGTVTPRHTCHD